MKDKLKKLRTAKGWTQAELAKRCGVSKRTVENWEINRNSISGPALIILRQLGLE